MRQQIFKKVPLFVTVSVLLTCIVFSGCAGRTVITDAQIRVRPAKLPTAK